MIRYLYNRQCNPPAPFVHVALRCPQTGKELTDVPAQLDTASDRTTVPWNVVEALALVQIDEALVESYGGEIAAVPVFNVRVVIRQLPPIDLNVFSRKGEPYVLLGRDVLNRYRIVLDGPQLAFEIG
jgi:hypothetical protein